MLSVLTTYLPWLALTIFLEVLIASLFAPRVLRRQVLEACVAMQVFTHPLATLAVCYAAAPFAPVEVAVFGVEALLYSTLTKLSLQRAIVLACVANVVSFIVGVLVGTALLP